VTAVGDAVSDKIAIGVFAGLIVGKVVGIFGGARLAVALRLGTLPSSVGWRDVFPVAVLGAIGYTVSLLIARLAFDDVAAQERSAAAVLVASTIASVVAVVLLRRRSRAS
jgi:NhaA family Na+:H+ antiporter